MRYLDENPLTVEEFNTYTDKFEFVSEHTSTDGEYFWAVDAPYRITTAEGINGIETYDENLKTWKVFAIDHDPDLDISFGIYFDHDDIPRIGGKHITISGDDIIIEEQLYVETPGL